MAVTIIHRFNSFEKQVAYFTHKTGIHLPRMTFGKNAFFKDLGLWSSSYRSQAQDTQLAYILPDPVQGFSFPRPVDVLSSALSLSFNQVDEDKIYKILESFGLPEKKATQPVNSLSGGEILLLNFAKADAMLPCVKGLVACSPIHWLNETRYKYWDRLVRHYHEEKRPVDVVLLEGEPFIDDEREVRPVARHPVPAIEWGLSLCNLKIILKEIQFPSYHPPAKIEYKLSTGHQKMALISPILMTGDNGIGKSIFAKVLSGIIQPARGAVSILAPNGKDCSRLIFQDVIDQLFGKSIGGHLNWVFRFDRKKREAARKIYQDIDAAIRGSLQDHLEADAKTEPSTLLQAKISLISERLATRPSVLILDEPGWGLSREVARKLVATVCQRAGHLNTAIILISHHARWWQDMVYSRLHLSQADGDTVVIGTK